MELKYPVIKLKSSIWYATVAMKNRFTTMIFDKTHHNYALKYFEPIAMLSWDEDQTKMPDIINISEFMMF